MQSVCTPQSAWYSSQYGNLESWQLPLPFFLLLPVLGVSAGCLSVLSSSFSCLNGCASFWPSRKGNLLRKKQPSSHQRGLDTRLRTAGYHGVLRHESDISCQHDDWLAVGQQHLDVWAIGRPTVCCPSHTFLVRLPLEKQICYRIHNLGRKFS